MWFIKLLNTSFILNFLVFQSGMFKKFGFKWFELRKQENSKIRLKLYHINMHANFLQ